MMGRFLKKIKSTIIPLRSSMLFIFISLFVTTTLLIIFITTIRYSEALSTIAHQRMKNASLIVSNRLTATFEPARVQANFLARLIAEDFIHDPEKQIIPLTVNIVKIVPLAISVFWGDQKGDYVYAKKEKDGSISSQVYDRSHGPATRKIIIRDIKGSILKKYYSSNLSFDHRVRPWYVQAEQKKQTTWTDIVYSYNSLANVITISSPVLKHGKFIGAIGIDIDITELSKFIKAQKITNHSYLFIITKQGRLITNPDTPEFFQFAAVSSDMKATNRNAVSFIYKTLNYFLQSGKRMITFSSTHNHDTYMVTYVYSKVFFSNGWIIGAFVPRSDLIDSLKKMHLVTIYISLIILALEILLVSGMVSHIVKPLKILVAETENIKQFHLDNKIAITSRIKEVIQLENAIESMKLGLKLFQKYLPKMLVRQLIESGEDIRTGGSRKTLTVLFSDIEHFTSIAEKLGPNILMQQMGEYFEELSQIIINEKGTIDKYIGDSIMAFWGAPLSNATPCHHAARSALRCQNKLTELNKIWAQKGSMIFITRIGIHMGDAIVGNVGSSERLNYTAIGDTINMASRLESINKHYKTKIIVSETVYEQIKDQFVLRMIDCVVVKGRTQSCCIYELLTDKVQNLEFDIDSYRQFFERGFAAYKVQSWKEAIEFFNECLKIYPEDAIAPIFITRCQQFQSNPPPSDWKGIME